MLAPTHQVIWKFYLNFHRPLLWNTSSKICFCSKMLWNPSRSLFQECNQLRLHESQLIWRCAISAERRTREQQISDAKQAIYCETKQTPFSPSFNSQRSRNLSEPNNGKCISFYKNLSLSIILQMDTGFSQKYRTYSKNTFTIKVMKYLWNINWTIGPFFRFSSLMFILRYLMSQAKRDPCSTIFGFHFLWNLPSLIIALTAVLII